MQDCGIDGQTAGDVSRGSCCSSGSRHLIPVKLFQGLNIGHKHLLRSNVRLVNYLGEKWENATLNVLTMGKLRVLEFYVVEKNSSLILGLSVCVMLYLVRKVETVQCKTQGSNLADLISLYPPCFEGIGELTGDYKIILREVAKPEFHAPRRPTEWVYSLVIIHKRDNSLRIYLGPADLINTFVREHFYLPISEQITSQMAGVCYISVFDASHGFWQIKLHESSTDYFTFNILWSCYKVTWVLTYIDDTICWGTFKEKHDEHLKAVMERALKISVRFNKHKCIIGVQQVCYMGHIVSARDIHSDATKVDAIHCMDVPTCKKDVERLLGVITYLSKFLPNLADATAPLRVLLRNEVVWHWEHEKEDVFTRLKYLLDTTPVLKYYDVNKPAFLSVDASQFG
ncbi:hypothetical protein PR048_022189 [Dryococelus australis]|uniref:Polyprotein n=1 Tax=Dryococelus australis TaxID=614101 RepID=A0ABQ9H0D5_9NEOP|nr:hypothetical protein PR048_022189 [Dryococelus australis]